MNQPNNLGITLPDLSTWHKRLRFAMQMRGYTSNIGLARDLDITSATVGKWLKEKTAQIEKQSLSNLCSLLRIRPEWLLNGELPMEVGETDSSLHSEIPDQKIAHRPLGVETLLRQYNEMSDDQRAALEQIARAILVAEPSNLSRIVEASKSIALLQTECKDFAVLFDDDVEYLRRRKHAQR